MSTSAHQNPELLDAIINAHGGLEHWNKIHSIELHYNFSGALLDLKGYPGHHQVTLTVDTKSQKATILGLGNPTYRRTYTPLQTTVELPGPSGLNVQTRENPRDSFAGHDLKTSWDEHYLTYFVGYTMWYYLMAPFIFTTPGFSSRELPPHQENGQEWRVLEVTFPENITTHNKVQKFYYDRNFRLCRMDYTAEVISTRPVSQYVYHHRSFEGISIPTLRRVVPILPDGAGMTGPSSFLLDFIGVSVKTDDDVSRI